MTPVEYALFPLPGAASRRGTGPRRGGRTALLAPPGPLDGAAAETLIRDARALILTGARALVVDLRDSPYIDSEGARALLALREEVSSHGGRVRLVVAECSRVERTLRLLDFGALFPIFRAVAEAWRA